MKFDSVLIANRGEIACRVIRSAKAQAYRTIAVFSKADEGAPHTRHADQAVCIGPGPATQSYLLMENIIKAAQDSGAQAVHPGYGFLSENAEFAQHCADAGLVFIGPSPQAIRVMGNKAEAKRRMQAAGVPCVPGYEGENQQDEALLTEGEKIGFPLMVKAAAGGGGRGMRLVREPAELPNAIKLARSEAENAFGSGQLILEKAIVNPRHVEVQVFADAQGNTIHLGERDCSVQRRHQKIIEEAPCPVMTPELREQMGSAAVAAARSIDYVGAGTVEFLLDSAGEFYFLEMNTRLQVEHPVTELITGIDLVALQLQVAQGLPLGFTQEQVQLAGHAIEVRLYSEDPGNDFLPSSGEISLWRPAAEDGIRVDDGIRSGQTISPFYDPMVAKIIARGSDRESARRKLLNALESTALFGVKNNKQFLIECLKRRCFVDGKATTAFIAEEFSADSFSEPLPTLADCAVAALLDLHHCFIQYHNSSRGVSPCLRDWSSASPLVSRRKYCFEDQVFDLQVVAQGSAYKVTNSAAGGESVVAELIEHDGVHTACLAIDKRRIEVRYLRQRSGTITVGFADSDYTFEDLLTLDSEAVDAESGGLIRAPMHGLLLELFVSPGQSVSRGERLAIIEAMKMQHEIVASADGVIEEVASAAGKQVAAGELLIEICLSD